jgi:site-specific recombinase XerD
VEEIIAVMRAAGNGVDGARLRALIVILWRAGLRIGEALGLAETDLDASRGAVLVRRGKGGRRREVGMDHWTWSQLEPWMAARRQLPVGALLCVLRCATAGRHWESSSARKQLARTAAKAGVRRRFAPHQLRHAHAVEMAHEGVPLVVIQLQHEQVETTQMYIHADLAIKERALARTKPLDSKPGRYRPPDALLGFLDGL